MKIPPVAVRLLRDALEHGARSFEEEKTLRQVITSLGKIKMHREIANLFKEILTRENQTLQQTLIKVMPHMAWEWLWDILTDTKMNHPIRAAAARALGEKGDIDFIRHMFNQRDNSVVKDATPWILYSLFSLSWKNRDIIKDTKDGIPQVFAGKIPDLDKHLRSDIKDDHYLPFIDMYRSSQGHLREDLVWLLAQGLPVDERIQLINTIQSKLRECEETANRQYMQTLCSLTVGASLNYREY